MFVSNSIIYRYSVGKKNDGFTNGNAHKTNYPLEICRWNNSVSMDVGICGILLHILFVLPIYPLAQTLKLQTYCTTQ
jgi:hypothetical protein